MKTIRERINANKEFFSLWLLLFFLTAFTARNVVPVFQDVHIVEIHHVKSEKCFISAAPDDSVFGTFLLKDSDVNDIDLTSYGNYTAQKQIVLPAEGHDFVHTTEHFSTYKIPLYDLYCNWKFHLS